MDLRRHLITTDTHTNRPIYRYIFIVSDRQIYRRGRKYISIIIYSLVLVIPTFIYSLYSVGVIPSTAYCTVLANAIGIGCRLFNFLHWRSVNHPFTSAVVLVAAQLNLNALPVVLFVSCGFGFVDCGSSLIDSSYP